MKGKLIIISGFSGIGKGTVINKLMAEHSGFVVSVSATTRYKRDGEIDGVHYFFQTKEQFEKGIAEYRFLEHACYGGNYYGTPLAYIEEQTDAGNNVILDIEYQGAFQVKKKYPEAVMMFMIPTSARVLYERLKNRGTETAEQICTRMAQSRKEIDIVDQYDTILVNDKLEQTPLDILAVVEDEQIRRKFYEQNAATLPRLREELDQILSEISC